MGQRRPAAVGQTVIGGADLVITSPPCNIGKAYNGNGEDDGKS
ncbi:hypothetical protein [Candidatus Spongiihabitans sp.]